MIKQAFIEAQMRRTRREGRVSPFLRRFVASTVDRAAREHYGDAYCMQCVKTSLKTVRLLRRLGVACRAQVGAFCGAEVFAGVPDVRWGGFWDKDHHAWTATEFGETVDISIAELVRHPTRSRPDGIPMPPVWWEQFNEWPQVIRYLPDSPIDRVARGPDTDDHAAFARTVDRIWDRTLADGRVDDVSFGPMLENVGSMNLLHRAGHPWLTRAIAVQDYGIPFPAWIVERERELVRASRAGAKAPSRLGHLLGVD